MSSSQKIYTLGPKGTFSYQAASLVAESPDQLICFTTTLAQIALEVEKDENCIGVLPIENSSSGIVGPAQDSLQECDVVIQNELSIAVGYSLVARVEPEKIKRFYCHSVAFNQCGKFLAQHMPQAEVIFSNSNIHSGDLFRHDLEETSAAIIPSRIAQKDEKFTAQIKANDLQDSKANTTRFMVIQKRRADYQPDFSKEKTSIYVSLHEDRHSLLFEILREFHVFNINLCRLESRPSREVQWQYGFFIDFYNNHRTQACLDGLKDMKIDYQVLGSYSSLEDAKSNVVT